MLRLVYWLVGLWEWFDLVTKHWTWNGGPVEFSTEHPSLLAKDAPHESRGVIRAYRAGWIGPRLSELLGVSQSALTAQVKDGLDEEGCASAAKRAIYDARVPKGTR